MFRSDLLKALCIAFCFILIACEDQDKQHRTAILGRWELTEGLRDAQPTETLAGTYFTFGADGNMTTNLPVGDETPVAYTVEKGILRQAVNPPVNYQIKTCVDSLLVLTMQLRGVDFELRLRRQQEAEY